MGDETGGEYLWVCWWWLSTGVSATGDITVGTGVPIVDELDGPPLLAAYDEPATDVDEEWVPDGDVGWACTGGGGRANVGPVGESVKVGMPTSMGYEP